MNIVHAKPSPRYDLETVLHNVFAPSVCWRLDPRMGRLLDVEWAGIRSKIEALLALDYPRPQHVGDSVVIEGYATITFDYEGRTFTVKPPQVFNVEYTVDGLTWTVHRCGNDLPIEFSEFERWNAWMTVNRVMRSAYGPNVRWRWVEKT